MGDLCIRLCCHFLAGFGGHTRSLVDSRDFFQRVGGVGRNGLTEDENTSQCRMRSIPDAVDLVIKGLEGLGSRKRSGDASG
jgi:hypothetical protein